MRDTPNELLYIDRDASYAEVFQYLKEVWIAALLGLLALRHRRFIYLAWSVVFLYFFLDDALEIHENFAKVLIDTFDISAYGRMRAQDFGELGTTLMFGSVLFLMVGGAYLYGRVREKRMTVHLLLLVGLLAFFGVAVDTLHSILTWGRSTWAIIEDGGEMIAMSLIFCYVFQLSLQDAPSAPGA